MTEFRREDLVTQSDAPISPVNELADRFWEALLELNPTTATVYGDERYDDRLEDPSPAGRAKTRALMERTKREAEAIPADGLLDRGPDHPRHARSSSPSSGSRRTSRAPHRLRVVDQIGGPQTLLPQLCQFQRADTPERLGPVHCPPEGLSRLTWRRTSASSGRGSSRA